MGRKPTANQTTPANPDQHSPVPWVVGKQQPLSNGQCGMQVLDAQQRIVCVTTGPSALNDAARIVACVNFCKRMDNDVLIRWHGYGVVKVK